MGNKLFKFFYWLFGTSKSRILSENMALITDFKRIDDAWMDAHPDVKVIGSPTTGTDHIDLEALEKRGIKLISLQGERKFLNNITSTAEHTFGLILSLLRDYPRAFNGRDWRPLGQKLSGKTLGIIGCKGRIGKQMKRIAKGFGMKVIGVDKKHGSWLELLARSDIVTVHIPLAGNEGFINYSHFAHMKPEAYFINTSRSGVVQKGHLLQALKDGKIKGAAMDFTDDPDLVKHAENSHNLILTDHIGGNTREDRAKTDEFIIHKMKKCLI